MQDRIISEKMKLMEQFNEINMLLDKPCRKCGAALQGGLEPESPTSPGTEEFKRSDSKKKKTSTLDEFDLVEDASGNRFSFLAKSYSDAMPFDTVP